MMVTSFAGKPCMLKCHIYHRPGLPGENGSFKFCRKAITMEGRQMDPVGQPPGQINDSPRQNPAYRLVAFFRPKPGEGCSTMYFICPSSGSGQYILPAPSATQYPNEPLIPRKWNGYETQQCPTRCRRNKN